MYAKPSGSPSTGSGLGAMETNIKAVLHRRTPSLWPLFPDAYNPPELGKSRQVDWMSASV